MKKRMIIVGGLITAVCGMIALARRANANGGGEVPPPGGSEDPISRVQIIFNSVTPVPRGTAIRLGFILRATVKNTGNTVLNKTFYAKKSTFSGEGWSGWMTIPEGVSMTLQPGESKSLIIDGSGYGSIYVGGSGLFWLVDEANNSTLNDDPPNFICVDSDGYEVIPIGFPFEG